MAITLQLSNAYLPPSLFRFIFYIRYFGKLFFLEPRLLWEIIRCPDAIRIHGSLTPACFVASHVRKYHCAPYLSWPHPKAIRISQHGSVRSAPLHLLSLLVKEEVSWRTCCFGWGSCPDTGNVPDEWVFNCQGSLRSLYASHVVDHGKGENIRLQEKNFEIFHCCLLSMFFRKQKKPRLPLGKSGRL